jgi:hypothetical protein
MTTGNERHSEWETEEFEITPSGWKVSRVFSVVFLTLAVISFVYAELQWQLTSAKDGMIGMGTSAYATVLYTRPIALACISAALAIISHGDLTVRNARVSRREVARPVLDINEPSAPRNDSDLIGNRLLAKLRGK